MRSEEEEDPLTELNVQVERADEDEDESTTLSVESRVRKALDEAPVEETKPRPASSPVFAKADRGFSMELPETLPEFPPSERIVIAAEPVGPRGPKGTLKIVNSAAGPTVVALDAPRAVPTRAQAPTAVVPPPRGTRWGRLFVLALLAGALGFGYVERVRVTAFARATTTKLRK